MKLHKKFYKPGLAIVKYLCELCRYRIELDSTWMVGSAFKVFWVNDGV